MSNCLEQMRIQRINACILLGSILFSVDCTDSERNHTTLRYYPNGKVRAVIRLLDGKLNGVTKVYYPNGFLRDSSTYLADSLNGPSFWFDSLGILCQQSHYTNGIRTGRQVIFNSTGKPVELHVYTQTGKLFYVDSYNSDGHPAGSGMTPVFEVKDTVSSDEKMTGFLWFGYPLKSRATLLIGTLGTNLKASDRYPLLDTLEVVEQSKDGRFYFAFQPTHIGNNVMGFKFIQPGSPWNASPHKDSSSVDQISGKSPFFVRKRNLSN